VERIEFEAGMSLFFSLFKIVFLYSNDIAISFSRVAMLGMFSHVTSQTFAPMRVLATA